MELARGDVHGQRDVGAEGEAGGADGLADQVERGPVAVEARREAALVAEAGREALLLQHRLERVVDLGAGAHRLGERRRPDRRDHELLDVDVGVGVRAAVEDVHHRHRQQVGVGPADVAVERQPGRLGRGLGDGERGAEDRVGAQVGLVGRARRAGSSPGRSRAGRRRRCPRWPGRSSGSPRRRPSARPCRGSGRRRRAARPPRTGRSTRRSARPRGRTSRRRAAPRPRRWGCRASRGSRGRRQLRWMPRVCSLGT